MSENNKNTFIAHPFAREYEKEKQARIKAELLLTQRTKELEIMQQMVDAHANDLKLSEQQLNETLNNLKNVKENLIKDTQSELEKLALYDQLTDLPNRGYFETHLSQEIKKAKRFHSPLALLSLDIDYFKKVNDNYGHDTGDKLLTEIASRLQMIIRREDFIARLGGDEFAIILTEFPNTYSLGTVAQQIIKVFNDPFHINGFTTMIGVSIGIANYNETDDDSVQLYKNADIALYSAKSLGRNNYQFFTPALLEHHKKRLQVETELNCALDRHEFFLNYQPRYDLQSGKISGVEALLRWQHPQRGILMPGEFLSVLEEIGLIVPIGEWVLETACRQYAEWKLKFPQLNLNLSINVSPRQLQNKNFIEIVINTIKKYNIPANCLELEVSETAVVSFLSKIENALFELQHMGVKFSIDDFGTGYASLNKLTQLPIQSIKIDRSFVKDIDTRANDNQIIKSTIDLAKLMGLNVVAQGVETEAQLHFLKNNNCPQAQGYFYCKPLPVDEMDKFLRLAIDELVARD